MSDRSVATTSPIVELRDLHHTYLDGTPRASVALRGVTLSIMPGERVAIVGPTMSGKSTVVDAFAHLVRLKRGMVFYEGRDIAAPEYDRTALRRRVGIVFQKPEAQIIEDVVGKDIAFGPTTAGLPAEETRRRVEESLNMIGLPYPEFRLRYTHALSGGQRRRVAIAGVLAMQTPLLVMDEPMAGLDPHVREGQQPTWCRCTQTSGQGAGLHPLPTHVRHHATRGGRGHPRHPAAAGPRGPFDDDAYTEVADHEALGAVVRLPSIPSSRGAEITEPDSGPGRQGSPEASRKISE